MECCKCGKTLTEEEVIKTDELTKLSSEIKNYCPECFLENVKIGFGNYNIGNCDVCYNPLVLQYDDEETISLARKNLTVHFVCKTVKDAIDSGNQEALECLDEEEHGWLILYTIEPNPGDLVFGWRST